MFAKIIGYLFLSILGIAVTSFLAIGIYSWIAHGDFIEQFQIWFNTNKDVVATIPSAMRNEVLLNSINYVKQFCTTACKFFIAA